MSDYIKEKVEEFLEILPHKTEVRNKFGGKNKIYSFSSEELRNMVSFLSSSLQEMEERAYEKGYEEGWREAESI